MVHHQLRAKDVFSILKRRIVLLSSLAALGLLIGYGITGVIPKRYTSKTTVLVLQPTTQLVPSVVTDTINQRLASMQQEILSRSGLEPVIRQLHLYPNEVGVVSMDDLVERLQKTITITAVAPMTDTRAENLPGFTISVAYADPEDAQKICAMVTSQFVQQSEKYGTIVTKDMTSFLDQQVQQAKQKLDQDDAKLADFQRQHLGSLPDDVQTNLNLLNEQTSLLDEATQALNRAQQDKSFAESMLAQQLQSWQASQTGQNPESLQDQLIAAQNQLATLRSKYTDSHPDVIKAENDVAALRQKIAQAAQQSKPVVDKPHTFAAEPSEILQLRAQIHQYDQVIKERQTQQAEIKKQIGLYQSRVQASPEIEAQYKLLTRDHQAVLDSYNDLIKKRDEAAMSQQLEESKQTERFQVLDAANLPTAPSFPNKPLFTAGGFTLGLILGLGITLLIELQDTSLRTEHDVEVVLRLPVLAVIPVVHPEKEHHRPSLMGGGSVKLAKS